MALHHAARVQVENRNGNRSYPRSMEELMGEWLPGKFGVDFQSGLTCFAGLAWTMWNNRNKMCISKCYPTVPMNFIHLGLSFLQK
jgi:hypothetical protein